MNEKGKYKIKKLIGDYGFYTEIELLVEKHDGRDLLIDFGYTASEWKASVSFGVHYFFEHHKPSSGTNVKVTVLDIRTMPVDTKKIVVVYATIMCLADIFKTEIKGLEINNYGKICFPK
ncbi:MAG: hypothetical protein AAFP19_17685 [Bacteroidota bacterium]